MEIFFPPIVPLSGGPPQPRTRVPRFGSFFEGLFFFPFHVSATLTVPYSTKAMPVWKLRREGEERSTKRLSYGVSSSRRYDGPPASPGISSTPVYSSGFFFKLRGISPPVTIYRFGFFRCNGFCIPVLKTVAVSSKLYHPFLRRDPRSRTPGPSFFFLGYFFLVYRSLSNANPFYPIAFCQRRGLWVAAQQCMESWSPPRRSPLFSFPPLLPILPM